MTGGRGRARGLALRRFWQGAALVTLGLVFWLSLTPSPPQIRRAPPELAYVVHVLMHFGIGLTLLLAAGPHHRRRAFAAMAVLVVGLEIAQTRVPHRSFDPADMLANALGALAAALLVHTLTRRARR
ncbi:VanZ family protein (plasmid) [Paroceanicella profunda]|uniref:VanZ family protein n=1 Tax=Paroceanicella profunda TaxID=2579971 RepID=A0A5B8G6J1_9RHOB|nr:VanZ family protein [Paroceanicella profunda]QDL94713.1 VanZ family protein [Paroceanicella profunda]